MQAVLAQCAAAPDVLSSPKRAAVARSDELCLEAAMMARKFIENIKRKQQQPDFSFCCCCY